ncbi:hypothetical protein FVE85_5015 [Porphyridium purpureum]|uniref:Uncharacterized protein n=1 Tax=Porphyridium purpureum TaxID=35688 RepID=A0A5J4YRH3_PORPP|nr:hypothetical protein FVE85_5015 [Porphyridium purpureum]|eukprot:POR1389..scf236_6
MSSCGVGSRTLCTSGGCLDIAGRARHHVASTMSRLFASDARQHTAYDKRPDLVPARYRRSGPNFKRDTTFSVPNGSAPTVRPKSESASGREHALKIQNHASAEDVSERMQDSEQAGTTFLLRPPMTPFKIVFADTKVLNVQLQLALAETPPITLARVQDILREPRYARTQYSEGTLSLLLRIARAAPEGDGDARAPLHFAIKALQTSRTHGVVLDSHILMHVLPLAAPLRKLNLVLAVKRLVQRQDFQLHHEAQLSLVAYHGLLALFGACRRRALVRDVYDEMRLTHINAFNADTFRCLMHSFVQCKDSRTAFRVWQMLRTEPYATLINVSHNAGLLETGALVCAGVAERAAEARWIATTYRNMVPELPLPARTLHHLCWSLVRDGSFAEARALMDWALKVAGGVRAHENDPLDARCLYTYMHECIEKGASKELLPLAHVLTLPEARTHLGANEHDRVQLVREYVRSLDKQVREGLLDAREAAVYAQRVFVHWKYNHDAALSSHMVCLAAREPTLMDFALRVVEAVRQANRADGHSDLSSGSQTLRAFAYEALVEHHVREKRVHDLIDVLFGASLDVHDASFAAASCIYAFGRLGRLELCKQVYKSCSTGRGCECFPDAVALFREMQCTYGSKLNEQTYLALTDVLEKTSAQIAPEVVAEMLLCLEEFMGATDVQKQSRVQRRAEIERVLTRAERTRARPGTTDTRLEEMELELAELKDWEEVNASLSARARNLRRQLWARSTDSREARDKKQDWDWII